MIAETKKEKIEDVPAANKQTRWVAVSLHVPTSAWLGGS
jgi:hypothetical protein